MPKDKRVRASASPAKPGKIRKQLRKTEADLAKAQRKRDEAVARVQALSIIADEIRARLSEADPPEAASAADTTSAAPAPRAKTSPARRTGTASKASAAARKPATARKPAMASKPATAKKPAAAQKPTAKRPAAQG